MSKERKKKKIYLQQNIPTKINLWIITKWHADDDADADDDDEQL